MIGLFFTLLPVNLRAQVFAAGQLNNSYIYTIIGENRPERLFTGASAEIGAEGPSSGIFLTSAIYIPRNYEFEKWIEDPTSALNFVKVE